MPWRRSLVAARPLNPCRQTITQSHSDVYRNRPGMGEAPAAIQSLQRTELGGVLPHWMPAVTPEERTAQALLVAPLTARSRLEPIVVRQARAPPNSIHTSHSTWASFISDMMSTAMKAAARTTPVMTRAMRQRYPTWTAPTASTAGAEADQPVGDRSRGAGLMSAMDAADQTIDSSTKTSAPGWINSSTPGIAWRMSSAEITPCTRSVSSTTTSR